MSQTRTLTSTLSLPSPATSGAAEEEEEEDKPAEYSYTVTTYTGNKWGAGTDANVLITIFGADADTGERKLDNTGNTFENSRYVAVKGPDVDSIEKQNSSKE